MIMSSILMQVELRNIKSRVDRSWTLTLDTNELEPSDIGQLSSMHLTSCKAYLTTENVIPKEIMQEMDDATINDESKSQSQRMRACLYRLWEQDYKEEFKTFALFYNHAMEKQINQIKNRLE